MTQLSPQLCDYIVDNKGIEKRQSLLFVCVHGISCNIGVDSDTHLRSILSNIYKHAGQRVLDTIVNMRGIEGLNIHPALDVLAGAELDVIASLE